MIAINPASLHSRHPLLLCNRGKSARLARLDPHHAAVCLSAARAGLGLIRTRLAGRRLAWPAAALPRQPVGDWFIRASAAATCHFIEMPVGQDSRSRRGSVRGDAPQARSLCGTLHKWVVQAGLAWSRATRTTGNFRGLRPNRDATGGVQVTSVCVTGLTDRDSFEMRNRPAPRLVATGHAGGGSRWRAI